MYTIVNKSQFVWVSIPLSQYVLSELVRKERKQIVYVPHCLACYIISRETHTLSPVTVGSRERLDLSFNFRDGEAQINLYL